MSVPARVIRTKLPLKFLSSRNQKRIADASKLSIYKKGEKIFNMGDRDDYLSFLIRGDIWLEAGDGKTKLIKHNHNSCSYALSKLKPRMFSAISANSHTCILWVNRTLLKDCMVKQIKNCTEETQLKLDIDCYKWPSTTTYLGDS